MFIETRLFIGGGQNQLLHTWMVELCMSHINHTEVNKGIPLNNYFFSQVSYIRIRLLPKRKSKIK